MLYVILPIYRRPKITHNFLKQLKNQDYRDDFSLVIVDASGDNSIDSIVVDSKEFDFPITLIKGTPQWYWGKSVVKGINSIREKLVHEDSILLINDDVVINSQYLGIASKLLDNSDRNTIFGSAIKKPNNPHTLCDTSIIVKNLEFKIFSVDVNVSELKPEYPTDLVSGRGMLIPAGIILSNLTINFRLFPHHLADMSFSLKAKARGAKLKISSLMVVELLPEPIENIKKTNFLNKYFDIKSNTRLISIASFWFLVYWLKLKTLISNII
jgi:GT2 family glycosyltransferase